MMMIMLEAEYSNFRPVTLPADLTDFGNVPILGTLRHSVKTTYFAKLYQTSINLSQIWSFCINLLAPRDGTAEPVATSSRHATRNIAAP